MIAKKWLKGNGIEVSAFGERVGDLAWELFGGLYHLSEKSIKRADWANKSNICLVVADGQFSTYDSDNLTRLVILSHKYNVRSGIKAATHGYIRLEFVNVDKTGFLRDRHPNIDEFLANVAKAQL